MNQTSVSTNHQQQQNNNHHRNQFKIEERQRQVASLLARSMTERQIAKQLKCGQATVHRDIEALREKSQEFVNELARSDLAFYFKQSIDGLQAAMEEAWTTYYSTNENIQIRDRMNALRIIVDCNVKRFELLQSGPAVMAMKSMERRLSQIETAQVPQ